VTWQTVTNMPPQLSGEASSLSSGNNSCVVNGNNIWFGTNKGRVFRSTDKGHNWTVSNTTFGNNGLIETLAFKDSLNGIAVNSGGTSSTYNLTTDGGLTWVNQPSSTPIAINIIEFIPGSNETLIGFSDWWKPYNNRRAAFSTDFGKTWNVFNSFIPFGGVEFVDQTTGYMGSIVYSTPVQNDTAMYKWDSSVILGIENTGSNSTLQIFPNPFIGTINLNYSSANQKVKKVEISDGKGKIYRTILPNDLNEYQIDLSGLKNGMYNITVYTLSGNHSRKIIKVE